MKFALQVGAAAAGPLTQHLKTSPQFADNAVKHTA